MPISEQMLTLAGGDVNGLLLNSRLTKSVMRRSSTGSVAIRLQLMSSETNFNKVTSGMKQSHWLVIMIMNSNVLNYVRKSQIK